MAEKTPAVHHLYRQPDAENADSEPPKTYDEPHQLWAVSVFNALYEPGGGRKKRSKKPLAIYFNSTPFDFSSGSERKSLPLGSISNTSDEDQEEERWRPLWRGCVFQIACEASAYFPTLPTIQGRITRGTPDDHPNYRPRYVTNDFKLLEIKAKSTESIVIISPFLYCRLKTIAGYYPSFFREHSSAFENITATNKTEKQASLVIRAPWAFLMHRFPQLEAFVEGNSIDSEEVDNADVTKQEILQIELEHARYLYNYLKPFYDRSVRPRIHALSLATAQISFDMLWYIYQPGTDVYIGNGDECQAMVISRVKSNLDATNDPVSQIEGQFWEVELWYLDTNGVAVGQQHSVHRLHRYTGLLHITTLSICPTGIWDAHDGGNRRRQFHARSQVLFRALKQGHLLAAYDGPAGKGHYKGPILIDVSRALALTKTKLPIFTYSEEVPYSDHFEAYRYMLVRETTPVEIGDAVGNEFEDQDTTFRGSSMVPPRLPRVPMHVSRYSSPTSESDSSEDSRVHIYRRPIIHESSQDESRDEPRYPRFDWREPREIPVPRNTKSTRTVVRQGQSPSYGELSNNEKPRTLTESLTDHQLLLLAPQTWGFALKSKQWLSIYTHYAVEATRSDESIENLVIDEDELNTIKALSTRQYSERDTWAADFIEGKGTGQIILLHGPPGVGKTYTVEAIAQYLGRPLLSLTVADIGTAETRVEQELLKWFSLAESWKAVLLVDEADIFLERRQNKDLARNGLVSAFLRRMEYFKGLLFLTTNRVGQIDDAFISRVHISIGYGTLTSESRAKIWQGFFRKLVKERAGRIQISPSAKKWVLETAHSGQAQLNGRDIRNALQTAITLAEVESQEDPDFDLESMTVIVDRSHFKKVLDISNKFQVYVQSIRREDERKRAAARYDRNDYWSESKDD